MTEPTTRTYRPNARVIFTTLDNDEAVLLHLDTKRYYTLNETGTRIWQLISDEKNSIADISADLSENYDVDTEVARSYVLEFLEDLHEDGLVERIQLKQSTT